jgi:glycosyltransferase involved in cell wall biosynthesis/GT2 family glycosyltransferase
MAVVLMISYSGLVGGAERALIDVAPALEGERCLACPEGQLADAARLAGIRVLPLADRPLELRGSLVRAALRLLGFRREVRALARDLDPSLVVASGMRPALALLLPAPAPPVVFAHHDLLPGRVLGALVRAAAARAALVVVPSRTVADDLGRAAVVVHPGVDVDRFPVAEPTQPPHAVLLGALVDWKRPELALAALALARRERRDLRLRVVGAPVGDGGQELAARLHERAARPDLAGAVEFVGAVEDPARELTDATVLLHCAPREPYGLAVVEALAAGRPVVAPAAGGPIEIVDDSCALLYPPGDAAAAARALVEVVSEPARAAAMGRAGRARARERFGVARARERFAALVGPLARRNGHVPAPLALVTVTHNSAPELRALLESVARWIPGARVVVVDCASSDETAAVAREVELIALDQNVGFGGACNIGVAAVPEAVTALVNPDVELLDDSLLALAAEAAHGPARLLAPLVLSPDGTRQDTVHSTPPVPVLPGSALAPWRSRRSRRVGWAVGCALVARTETLAALGPFDEQIFLYGEDLDLGLRAAAAGVETWFWPSARVLHTGAHASSKAFGAEPFELLARARHEVVARRLGSGRARVDDAAQALTFASRIAAKGLLRRPVARERAQLRALRRSR